MLLADFVLDLGTEREHFQLAVEQRTQVGADVP